MRGQCKELCRNEIVQGSKFILLPVKVVVALYLCKKIERKYHHIIINYTFVCVWSQVCMCVSNVNELKTSSPVASTSSKQLANHKGVLLLEPQRQSGRVWEGLGGTTVSSGKVRETLVLLDLYCSEVLTGSLSAYSFLLEADW